MDEAITRADPRLRTFPAAQDVFVADQDWLARHLHPLLSIDLSAVDPDWDGWLHLVTPLEPHDGYVGGNTQDVHNDFTGENWIAFRREADGRYRFLGAKEYFLLEQASPSPSNGPRQAAQARTRAELEAHYAVQRASYEASIHRFARYGALTHADPDDPLSRSNWGEGNLLDQLGGGTCHGNWTDCPDIPAAFEVDTTDPENVFPRWKDGAAFRFVASVSGYPWQDSGADAVILFYEPVSQTVLLTFDWT